MYLTVNYDPQQFQLVPAVTNNVVASDLVPFDYLSSVVCLTAPPDHWFIGVIVLSCVVAIILIILCILSKR